MKISKQEFLKLLDDYLPDDATIIGWSPMAGEAFELDDEVLEMYLPESVDAEDAENPDHSTHILYLA